LNDDGKTTFSNIMLKGKAKNNYKQITRDMIFKETVVKTKRNGEQVTELRLNADYWKNIRKTYPNGINVVIDEAHTLINSRRAMSKENVIMNDFMSLLRRILGDSGEGYGELVLITQLGRRLDVIARDLSTSIHYHLCHYRRVCDGCGFRFWETNEIYQKPKKCPICGSKKMRKDNFIIEKWEFKDMDHCDLWLENGHRTYQTHYYITDIQKYFSYYDTHQWENLISEY